MIDSRRVWPGRCPWLPGALPGVLALVWLCAGPALALDDPLPAWRDGAHKARILDYVARVTTPGSRDYITPAERIAVFGDDGTLWPERPSPQGLFALQRLRTLAPRRPAWRDTLPFRAALELGDRYLQEATTADLTRLVAAVGAGQTQDDFRHEIEAYLAIAGHPRLQAPLQGLAYVPMRELVNHLRANGFRCFVVTAGSIEVSRAMAAALYAIPADDVIGSSVVMTVREEDERLVLRRLETLHALNDAATRPLAVELHVGRRPVLAIGHIGTGGDITMLRYSQTQSRPTLQLLLRHDDFEREYAYDEADGASLDAAHRHGWMVVSMRHGWRRVFTFGHHDGEPSGMAP